MLPRRAIDIVRSAIGYFCLLFWSIRFKGVENIPLSGGLIVASNHQTYLDPFWLSLPFNRPLRYLAWDAAFGWPVIGRLIESLGAWPLQLEKGSPSIIRRSLEWLGEGGTMVIFPEGKRGRPDGSMIGFKVGAVRLALQAGVPILPVTIRGANRIWPTGRSLPRLGCIEIIYHPLYRAALQPGEDLRACARRESERLAAVIGSAL
jgi:1-acyl-sn-glycerol-3-phosphate acyltransferase